MNDTTFVEECIVKAGGGFGRFQKIHSTQLALLIYAADLFVYALVFFSLTPALECPLTDGDGNTTWILCSREDACDSKTGFRIDEDNVNTIENFITKIEPPMICDENYTFKSSMFGTTFMIALLVSNIFITPFGDVFGRRSMYIVFCGLQTIFLLALSLQLSTDKINYYVVLAMIFLIGLFSSPRWNISVIYFAELSTLKYSKLIFFVSNLAAASFALSIGIYFFCVKSVVPGMYFITALHGYATIHGFYLPESPQFAYASGQIDLFKASIRTIAKANRVEVDVDELVREREQSKDAART